MRPVTDAVNGDGAWTAPTLSGSWANYGGTTFNTAGYRKVGQVVYFKGLVKSGTGTIFVLPAGYRPPDGRLIFTCYGDGALAEVDIYTTGEVHLQAGTATTYLSLDNISFWVGA